MIVLITGASSGIGYELAKCFARKKEYTVIATARRHEKLTRLKNEIESGNYLGKIEILSGDLTKIGFIQEIKDFIEKKFARLDVLINNAADLILCPFEKISGEQWKELYEINLFAPIALTKHMLPFLKSGKDKSEFSQILNISTMGAIQGSAKFPGLSAYSSSKAALINFGECLAEELKQEKVWVNNIALGSVQTEMFSKAFPGSKANAQIFEVADFIFSYVITNRGIMSGKTIQLSSSTP